MVTIPSLPDAAQWEAFEAARQAMVPNFAQEHAAARYRVDDALTRDQAGFREAVAARLEQLIRAQDLGIVVEQIDNLRAIPPDRKSVV